MNRVRRIDLSTWTEHRILYGNGQPPKIVGVIHYHPPTRLEAVRQKIRDAWDRLLDLLGVPV